MNTNKKRQSLQTLLFIDVITCIFSLVFIYFALIRYPQFLHQMMESDLISPVWLAFSFVNIFEGVIYEISPFTSTLGKVVALRKSFPEGRLSYGYGSIALGLACLLVWLDLKSAFLLFHYLVLAAFVAVFLLRATNFKRMSKLLG